MPRIAVLAFLLTLAAAASYPAFGVNATGTAESAAHRVTAYELAGRGASVTFRTRCATLPMRS